MPVSPISSSTFDNIACISTVCKKYVNDVVILSHDMLDIDVIYPSLEKKTTCIKS